MSQPCPRCEDTGWVDCDTPWCSEQEWHGGYCSCPVGLWLREYEEDAAVAEARNERRM